MALQTVRIGALVDVFQYDDGDFDSGIETSEAIKAGPPTDPDDVLRLSDIASLVLSAAYPIGSVYLSVVSTNPNTLLGFGTWVRIAEAQYLVGFKTTDADFGVVEATGGNKNHTHDVDIGNTTSTNNSSSEEVDNNLDASTAWVAAHPHTHDVDPASIASGNNSQLPPFYVIYIWKRTA